MKKVFRMIGSTEEIPYNTPAITVEKQVVCQVRQPLWTQEGKRLTIQELANAGVEVYVYPDQTTEYVNYKKFTALFAANPDLEPRVQEYKAFFDELGIAYNSNTDQMEAAMVAKFGDDKDQKLEFYSRMETALTNVKVNYQAAIKFLGEAAAEYTPADDFITWLHTPLLIQYMPSSNPVEPEYRTPYVATEATENAEREENSANAQAAQELVEQMQSETSEE